MKKLGLLISAIVLLAGVASAQTTIFSDNMESFPSGWTLSPTTGWVKSATRYNSASNSARCDDVSPYANSQNNYMTRSVSLSGYSSATLKFYIWQYTESGYDYVYVQYYSGTTWTTAWSRAGNYQSWAQQSVTIPVTATQIRFWFKSDASVTYTGAYIDDVVLTGTTATAAAEWTIMVYLNADNNLETDGINDFLEMAAASYSSGKVNVIVQMDRSSGYATTYENWTSCKRFKIANGMTPIAANQISDIGEADMGNLQTLADFAKWAIQYYPANKYSLVMWDHGDGWYKGEVDPPLFKGFSNDDSHGSVINVYNGEMANALNQIKTYLGRNLDHVGWDACLMGMWEVLDISRNYANVANVSEETEGAAGWYYTTFLNNLNTTPTMSAIDLGKAIINGTSGQSTLSVVDLTLVADLNTRVNTLATELMAARGAGLGASISTALNNTLKFSPSYFSYHIDLSDFAAKVKAQITSRPTLTTACDNVISAVTSAVKLYKNSSTYANARGIAIYHCKIDGSNYDVKYNSLPVAANTQWDEYIKGGSSGGTNYTKTTATYSWDASATTATGCTGDDQSVNKSIGFSFNFYGTAYTTVNICSNGFLSFTSTSTAYTPVAIPNTVAPNALIAGLWRDLNPAGGGNITYYSSSTKFVVSFNAVKNYSNTSTQTFQVILTPDGKIKIQWGSITTETYASGVENTGGTLGVGTTAAANSAALFTPPTSWDSTIPEDPNVQNTRFGRPEIPVATMLAQNAPNPVRYKTLIAYQLEKPGDVSLKIYNLNGQLVRTLASGQHNSGYYQVMWDTKDNAGRKVAHGVYIYKLISGEFNYAKKMVLVK